MVERLKRRGAATQDNPAKRVRPAKTKTTKSTPDTASVRLPNTTSLNSAPTTVLDVLVFGCGEAGELGLGPKITNASRPTPNPFLNARTVTEAADGHNIQFKIVQLACGGMHTVALTHDNKILTWGVNDNCALGRNTEWDGGFQEINGDDSSSNDGDGLNPLESTPTAIPDTLFPRGTVFVQVAAGDSCSFALTNTGLVYGWGSFRTPDGKEFFLPGKPVGSPQPRPALIPGLQGITQIAAGANHALALEGRVDNVRGGGKTRHTRLWAWGCGDQHQLGRRLVPRRCPTDPDDGRILYISMTPSVVELRGNSTDNIAFVASGEYHAFAVGTSGRVWAWGLNSFGETGAVPQELRRHGADADPTVATPTQVAALADQNVVALAGGGHHSVAVTKDGRCLAWGRVDSGQLGIALDDVRAEDEKAAANQKRLLADERGRPRACLVPTEANLDGFKAVAVACGTEHTLVVTSAASHAVFGSGFNAQAQLGLGSDAEDEVVVATRVPSKSLRDRRLTWAGAGGQFSMVAGPADV